MRLDYDILIIGGGMVGSALACSLGGTSLRVGMLERQAPPPPPGRDYDLRVSAITAASRAMFEALSAWPAMTVRRVAPIREMRVWDQGGSGHIHFDSADIGEPCLGYIIENGVILAALRERLAGLANAEVRCPVAVERVEIGDQWATVTDAHGISYRARLLVGADGADSPVRAAAGIAMHGRPYDQEAIVASVRTAQSHRWTAWQRFLSTGPLAFLPLPDAQGRASAAGGRTPGAADEHHCSIVWSADSARARALLALDDAAFVGELQEAIGNPLGAIEWVGPRASHRLRLGHAEHYVGPRLALVGDAAHTVHPLAGQGVNLGLYDAAALAEVVLAAAARRRDIGALQVLRRYERWRKAGTLAMLAVTDGFERLFGSPQPALKALRNAGLTAADHLGPAKHLIMRYAAGLIGDRPRLARGLPLA